MIAKENISVSIDGFLLNEIRTRLPRHTAKAFVDYPELAQEQPDDLVKAKPLLS